MTGGTQSASIPMFYRRARAALRWLIRPYVTLAIESLEDGANPPPRK